MTKKSFNVFHISNDDPSGNNAKRTSDVETTDNARPPPRNNWRDLTAYWIFGLCNNFGYVVMLTAAKDILEELGSSFEENQGTGNRPCNLVSTGVVLLADILPGLCIKILSPFLPFWHTTRITVSCLVAIGGFVVVAFAKTQWAALVGVGMTSFASGLGEPTFLAYSAFFNKDVISTWSSGTGGAGIFGAIAYTVLREIGLSNQQTMLVMTVAPVTEYLAFLFLLTKPASLRIEDQFTGDKVVETVEPLRTFKEKIVYIKELVHFMLPLCLVYLFEYYINQGLFEMAYFPENILDLSSKQQYRYYQVTYQVGVFISRSSVNIVHIKQIWIMAVLQGLNVVFFLFEAIYMFTPSIWIIFGVILFEGLLGGGAYVNTFYRMSREISATRREYAMSVVTLSDTLGITLAGFLAMPTHNWICGLPGPRIP